MIKYFELISVWRELQVVSISIYLREILYDTSKRYAIRYVYSSASAGLSCAEVKASKSVHQFPLKSFLWRASEVLYK